MFRFLFCLYLFTLHATQVVVSGAFDDLKGKDIRFLEEASKLGDLTVFLSSDDTNTKFPLAERLYFLNAIRYVNRVEVTDRLPEEGDADIWADRESPTNLLHQEMAMQNQMNYQVISEEEISHFPPVPPNSLDRSGDGKKVIVTGCFDWFHSGHVRFIEECAAYGDLYVVVGNDPNIRLLKGEGHPFIPEDERFYVVQSIKFQKQTLMSPGRGYLDSDSLIRELKPDIYAVNEDGDKGGKREYCQELGIEYLVLKREPASGLPVRSSTALRGF